MPATSLSFLDKDQPWYKGKVSDALWSRLKARLTGGTDSAGIQYSSFVRLSSADADKIIAKMKKDPRGYPQVDQKGKDGGYSNLEAYQNWLVEEYLESNDPPGLDDLLSEIREEKKELKKEKKPTSSALVPVGTKATDLVEEQIDERILSILGLQDAFDFTYEEYLTLLKEKAVAARMSQQGMPTESVELITDELKRVKGKTGKFKVKSKKVDINKIVNRTGQAAKTSVQLDPTKLLPPAISDSQEEQQQEVQKDILDFLKNDLLDALKSINSVVEDILGILKEQRAVDAKKAEQDRKNAEVDKKKKRETKLESGAGKKMSSFASKVAKPFTNFFDTIKNFFMNILLGSAVLFLLNVIKNPNIILNPLKNFANMIIGFLNGIISFLWNLVVSPINFVINGINAGIQGLINQINSAIQLIPGAKPITAPQLPTVPGPPQIPTFPVQQQEGGGETINIGDISLMSGGGVDNKTGVKVSGFGKDTQLTALSPGEVVFSNPAADFWGRDNLLAMNAMGGGNNTPKFGSLGGVQTMQGGGEVIFGAGHAARSKGSTVGTDNLPVQGTQDPRTRISESTAMMHLIEAMQKIKALDPKRYAKVGFHNITDTSGPTGMTETTRRIEGQGKQFIELHLDQHGGGRSGVISRNLTAIDKALGSLFGYFPTNFKQGKLAIPDAGGTIVELAAIDDPKLRGFLDEVKANKYGPATQALASKIMTAAIGKSIVTSPPPPPAPAQPRVAMLPLPVGGGQQTQTSSTGANQAIVPGFSAEDPFNMSNLVVKSIYNMVG